MMGVLVSFSHLSYHRLMVHPEEKLTPANPKEFTDSLAFALRLEGASDGTTRTSLWPTLWRNAWSDT
jgi:hypothetical protein